MEWMLYSYSNQGSLTKKGKQRGCQVGRDLQILKKPSYYSKRGDIIENSLHLVLLLIQQSINL
jgi:hypothetical protein